MPSAAEGNKSLVAVQTHRGLMCILTCTVAKCEAQPPLGAIKHHVEAFHNGRTDHQPVHGGRHAKSEAVQRAVHVCDLLDVKLRDIRQD